jgi:hypothetical protein
MHLGLDDWPATAQALTEIDAAMRVNGHAMDRYGLCLSQSMGVVESDRAGVAKETGPRLETEDWAAIGETAPIQPHLGDYMIGTLAGLENTRRALAAGVTTIGNLGQYFAFEPPGGGDDIALTETTVRALRTLGALRGAGALRDAGHQMPVIFGGRLNEDIGEGLPSDVRPLLEAMGCSAWIVSRTWPHCLRLHAALPTDVETGRVRGSPLSSVRTRRQRSVRRR